MIETGRASRCAGAGRAVPNHNQTGSEKRQRHRSRTAWDEMKTGQTHLEGRGPDGGVSLLALPITVSTRCTPAEHLLFATCEDYCHHDYLKLVALFHLFEEDMARFRKVGNINGVGQGTKVAGQKCRHNELNQVPYCSRSCCP